jgi:hypothetical protein
MADFPYSIRAESLITESCGKIIMIRMMMKIIGDDEDE